MATWDDVIRLATSLPGVTSKQSWGNTMWRVNNRGFVWERPLGKSDLAALGDDAPAGPILGARVPDLGVKEALVQGSPGVYFTIPHFDGYPAVLVRLDEIDVAELEELVVEAWLDRASKSQAKAYLDGR